MKVSGQSFSLTALVTPGWTYVCVCVCHPARQCTPEHTILLPVHSLAWIVGARYISVRGDALMNAATGQVHPGAHPWDIYVNYVTYTTTSPPARHHHVDLVALPGRRGRSSLDAQAISRSPNEAQALFSHHCCHEGRSELGAAPNINQRQKNQTVFHVTQSANNNY